MYVLGTAGHVDHGKSELVQALTGIHPDRLPEEKKRGMTIDLGFAWIDLPQSGTVGIVDVPGHIDFIDNMLSGVGMIDAVMIVIAADEGVMPQTQEHLDILDLLAIKQAVAVITKCDLVDQPEWLDLVESDVRNLLKPTRFREAPVIRTSAVISSGIEELRRSLDDLLKDTHPKRDVGKPRLHLDRIFTLKGFGTIVTGTLLDGKLIQGCEVAIAPSGLSGRIRAMQSHHKDIEVAHPGTRVAVNLSGVEKESLQRGDTLILPGSYTPTTQLDAQINLLARAGRSINHNQTLKLFLGSSQRLARVRVLGAEEIPAGSSGWAQLELDKPLIAIRRDRFILRQASPARTIAGGVVINPHPLRKHRRYNQQVLSSLQRYAGNNEEVVLEILDQHHAASMSLLIEQASLSEEVVREIIESLTESGSVRTLMVDKGPDAETLFVSQKQQAAFSREMKDMLSAYHAKYPLRNGMPLHELQGRLSLNPAVFRRILPFLLEGDGFEAEDDLIRLQKHAPRLSKAQKKAFDALLARFDKSPATPPSVRACLEDVSDELLQYAIQERIVTQVSQDVVFLSETYNQFYDWVRKKLEKDGELEVTEFRDQFGSTRKYSIAFLEHLNQAGLTRFVADRHIANRPLHEWPLPSET